MTEQAPNLEQIEGAKSALLTFCMYYYQALRQDGDGVDEAKRKVAAEIEGLYKRYAEQARMEFRLNTIRNPHTMLDEIIADTKALGLQARPVYQKLLDFKRLIE